MRLWQINFQVYRQMPLFSYPGDLVEELQTNQTYRIRGSERPDHRSGQLALTLSRIGGFRVRDQEYRLKPGTAFLALYPDPDHEYFYPPESHESWVFFWIAILGNSAEKMIADLVQRCGYFYQLDRNRGIIKRLYSFKAYRNTVQVLTPTQVERGGKSGDNRENKPNLKEGSYGYSTKKNFYTY